MLAPFIPTAHRKGCGGRPRPQTKVQFHQPTRPPSPAPRSPFPGDKGPPTARARLTFSNRRFRFPQNGPELFQSIAIPIYSWLSFPAAARGPTRNRYKSCISLIVKKRRLFLGPETDGEACGSGAFDRLAPLFPSIAAGGKVPTLQRQRWHGGWVRLSLKSWRTPAAQPGAEGPPVQLNMGKPPVSHQDTRPNSPTCPVVIMTRITRRHESRGSDGWAVCPSIWLAHCHPEFVHVRIHSPWKTHLGTKRASRGRQSTVQIQQRAVAAPTYPRCR